MSIRRKIWLTFVGIIVLAFVAGMIVWPKGPDISYQDYYKELKFHLGLDLQGGVHLIYEADLSKIDQENHEDSMDGVRDVIERRVNIIGVSEPIVQTVKSDGKWRLIVELAGVTDVSQAIEMIGQTPYLDFREPEEDQTVEESENNEVLKEGGDEEGEEVKNEEQEDQINTEGIRVEGEGDDAKLVDAEGNPIDMEKLQKQMDAEKAESGYPGFKMTELTGQHLNNAQLQFDPNTNVPAIALEFNDEGKRLFAEITERNIGNPVGIFLDGEAISVPTVQDSIRDGKAIISGDFTIDEAKQLAMRLNAGALPVPIDLISQQTVGASLGKTSIEKSFMAGIIGLVLVCLFMIAYYRLPGVLAVFALIIYALIVLALFKFIPVTLTLAGIAGFILSIGIAVDANVLIFERIKEELNDGNNLHSSVEEGFKHAWISIRDSNISTIITCIILAWFGVGILKGFAITLGIGVLISMFSAITITRTFLRIFARKGIEKRPWLFGVKKKNKEAN
jgi:preprotein translocase subunit SecD